MPNNKKILKSSNLLKSIIKNEFNNIKGNKPTILKLYRVEL